MKKILNGLAGMASLTACGSRVCKKLKDGVNKVASQARTCGVVQEDPDYTGEQEKFCESAMDIRSDSEKPMLEDFADCVNDIVACPCIGPAPLQAQRQSHGRHRGPSDLELFREEQVLRWSGLALRRRSRTRFCWD